MNKIVVKLAPWLLLSALFVTGLLLPHFFKSNSKNNEDNVLFTPEQCLFNHVPCEIQAGSFNYTVKVVGEVSPLKPFSVTLHGEDIDAVTLSFDMRDMDMGVNRFIMKKTNGFGWETQAMLPVCSAGRNDWIAEFMIKKANQTTVKLVYPFVTFR